MISPKMLTRQALILSLIMFNLNAYANEDLAINKGGFVTKFSNNNSFVTLKIPLCPVDAPMEIGINFIHPEGTNKIVYAELKVLTPKAQCFTNTFKEVTLNLKNLIKTEAQKAHISAEYILMKTLPIHIEIDQEAEIPN